MGDHCAVACIMWRKVTSIVYSQLDNINASVLFMLSLSSISATQSGRYRPQGLTDPIKASIVSQTSKERQRWLVERMAVDEFQCQRIDWWVAGVKPWVAGVKRTWKIAGAKRVSGGKVEDEKSSAFPKGLFTRKAKTCMANSADHITHTFSRTITHPHSICVRVKLCVWECDSPWIGRVVCGPTAFANAAEGDW